MVEIPQIEAGFGVKRKRMSQILVFSDWKEVGNSTVEGQAQNSPPYREPQGEMTYQSGFFRETDQQHVCVCRQTEWEKRD